MPISFIVFLKNQIGLGISRCRCSPWSHMSLCLHDSLLKTLASSWSQSQSQVQYAVKWIFSSLMFFCSWYLSSHGRILLLDLLLKPIFSCSNKFSSNRFWFPCYTNSNIHIWNKDVVLLVTELIFDNSRKSFFSVAKTALFNLHSFHLIFYHLDFNSLISLMINISLEKNRKFS